MGNFRELHRLAQEVYSQTEPEVIREILKPLGFTNDERVMQRISAQVQVISRLTADMQRETRHLAPSLLSKLKKYGTQEGTRKIVEACSTDFKRVFEQRSCEPKVIASIGIALGYIAGTRIAAEAILKNPVLSADSN